jgi:hypothetical protein
MRRKLVPFQRGLGEEGQEDAGIADLEENMTARLLAKSSQAEDSSVKVLGGVEVIDVDGGLNDGVDVHFVPCWSILRNCLAHSVNQRTAKIMSHTHILNIAMTQNQTFWTKGQSAVGPHKVSSHAGRADMTAR